MKYFLILLLFGLNYAFFSQEIKKIDDLKINDIENYSDYSVFDSLILNKRLIFLGESGHSGHEYNYAKYKIIKYLHENHNFNVVIFESGMADCFHGNNLKNQNDSLWLLKHSIYTIWSSTPTLMLMDYMISNNLKIGGFDYQNSSMGSTNSEFLKMIKTLDSSLINETYQNDVIFSNYIATTVFDENLSPSKLDSIKTLSKLLISNYTKLNNIITNQNDTSLAYYSKIISNKLFLLNNFENRKKLSALRDSVMSNNIKWYYDSLYPNEKIIVWGANDHIAKERSNFSANYYAGSILPERIKMDSYYIGFYAYSGEMYNYSAGNFKIVTPHKKSLEGRLHTYFDNNNDVFLDVSTISNSKKLKWVNKKTLSFVWGRVPVYIVPKKYYDGIILINNLSIKHF